MALVPILSIPTVADDGSYIILQDDTVYGAPNQDRVDVAVYLTAYKVDETFVETALTVDAFDPETATQFQVNVALDGRTKFYFIIADNWDIAVEYNQYDVVYDTTQKAFYEYINTTPSTGNAVTDITYWAVLADPTTKVKEVGSATESGNLTTLIYERILDYNTAKCYGDAAIKVAKEACGAEDCECKTRIGVIKSRLRSLLFLMRLSDQRQRYADGEKYARTAERYCVECCDYTID